jgi:hypothetical protein
MKEEKSFLLFLVTVGMELSYLYACSTFLTTSIFNHPFPFPEAVGSFVLAAVLTLLSQGRGWRVIYVLALQALGFIPALLRIANVFSSWLTSFSSQTWLVESNPNTLGAAELFVGMLVLLWAVVFWGGGMGLARRPADYYTICSRFDRGLIAFFILFLIKFLLRLKGGIKIEEPVSEFLLFPFLIFSLLAIGLVRNRSAGPRDFLPGYQGIGVILSFIVVILLFGTGLVLFCLPYLTLAAEAGYGILKIVGRPVGSILVKVLLFIFGHTMALPEKMPVKKETSIPDLSSQGTTPWWMELLGKILAYGLWIILGLLLLIIVGVTLYYLYRWLLSRTALSEEKQSPRHLIALWLEKLRLFLHSCWRWLLRRIKGYKGAIPLYTALRTWGRHSGLPHSLSETPTEYGSRLKHRFPVLKREIELIIEVFNETVYGEIILNENQLTTAQSAWRRLRSPLHWPLRLKTWFLRPSHLSEAIQYHTLDRNLIA